MDQNLNQNRLAVLKAVLAEPHSRAPSARVASSLEVGCPRVDCERSKPLRARQVMYKAPGHALDSSKGQTKASLAAEKDEVAKRFAGALIIRTDGAIRAPVVTLQGEKANLYNVIEKHLRPEVVVGAERFWKLIRAMYSPNLDTWRPRVNGVQLKALQGARLPETDQEWHCVKVVLDTIADWIREDTSPEAFLQELKELVAYCESWWDNRTKREGTC